jgi:hypothetical protein
MNQGTNQNLLSASVTLSDDIDELFFLFRPCNIFSELLKLVAILKTVQILKRQSCYPSDIFLNHFTCIFFYSNIYFLNSDLKHILLHFCVADAG